MLTLIILLNILIALFNSAYENVAGDAMAQYMAFFAQSTFISHQKCRIRAFQLTRVKQTETIASVRAPDQFVYVA